MASFYENLSNYNPTTASTSFQNIVVSGQVASQTAFIGSIRISTTNMGNFFDPDLLNLGTGLLTVNGDLTTSGLVNGIDIQSLDTSVVKLTGNQTIAGDKTFSGNTTNSGSLTVSGTTALGTTTTGAINVIGTVTADGLSLGDDKTLSIGDGNDFTISHNSTNHYTTISETNTTGGLDVKAANFVVKNATGTNEYQVVCQGDGASNQVLLYHGQPSGSGDYKLATTSTGVEVKDVSTVTSSTGNAQLNVKSTANTAGNDLGIIEVSGTDGAYIDIAKPDGTGYDLRIQHVDENNSVVVADTSNLIMQVQDTNRAVILKHGANSPKLTTTTTGINVTGNVGADGFKLYRDDGVTESLDIFTDSNNDTFITENNTDSDGSLKILGAALQLRSDDLRLMNRAGTETYFEADVNGAAKLFYDNSTYGAAKLETTATGVDVTGTVTADGVTVGTGDVITLGGYANSADGTSQNLRFYINANGNAYIDHGHDSGGLIVSGRNFNVKNDASEMLIETTDTTTSLYHNSSANPKLDTTSTGIDVTGTVTATGIALNGNMETDGNITVQNGHELRFEQTDGTESFSIKTSGDTTNLLEQGGGNLNIKGDAVVLKGNNRDLSKITIHDEGGVKIDSELSTDTTVSYTRIKVGNQHTGTRFYCGTDETNVRAEVVSAGLNVNGTVTADAFSGNATSSTIAKGAAVIYDASNDGAIGHATVAGFVGKTVVYTNTVNGDDLTLGLPDVGVDIQIGEQIHLINASTGNGATALIILDLSESGTGQTLNICTGASVLSNTGTNDPHIVQGGVATLIATADNTYALFGSGIVDN